MIDFDSIISKAAARDAKNRNAENRMRDAASKKTKNNVLPRAIIETGDSPSGIHAFGGKPQARPKDKISQKKGILESAFDKENYIDKLKKGDTGGAAANFIGSGVQSAQSLLMNLSSNIDSVVSGDGLKPFDYNMTFSDYEKAVAGRRGGKGLTEQLSEAHPVLGGAYNFGMEVATDPLSLIDGAGFLKNAGLKKAGSAVYMDDMAKSQKKFMPTAVTQKTEMLDEKGRTKTVKTQSMPLLESKESLGGTGDRFYMGSPRVLPEASEAKEVSKNTILGLPAPKSQPMYVSPKGDIRTELTEPFIQGRRAIPVDNASDIRVAASFAKEKGTTLKELPNMFRREVDTSIQSVVDGITRQLTEYKPKGVDVAYLPSNSRSAVQGVSPTRISNNDPLYFMFYKEYGHAPTKDTAREFAEGLIERELNGGAKYFLDDKTVADYEVLKFLEELSHDVGDDFIKMEGGKAVHGKETEIPVVDYAKGKGPVETPFRAYSGEIRKSSQGGVYFPTKEELNSKPNVKITPVTAELPTSITASEYKGLRKSIADEVREAPWYGKSLVNKDPVYTENYGALTGRVVGSTVKKNQSYKTPHGVEQLAIMRNLDTIFQNAVVIQSKNDRNGTGRIDKIHTLLSPVKFPDGRQGVVKLNVKEYVDPSMPNKIHENKVLEIIKEPEVYVGRSAKQTGSHLSDSTVSVAELIEAVKGTEYYPSAKKIEPVLDESSYLKGGPNLIEYGSNKILSKAREDVKEFKDLGADTNRIKATSKENIETYGAMKKGETLYDAEGNLVTRDIDIPKGSAYGDNQQYIRTLMESQIVDDALFKLIDDTLPEGYFAKHTKGNHVAVERANKVLERGLESALERFKAVLMSGKQAESIDIALGNRVLQELQKQGRYQEALDVAGDLSIILSEAGRTLQASRIAKRLSPEGRLQMLKRAALKIEEKTGQKITMSDKTAERISKATTEREIAEANEESFIEMWDQVPARWIDKINAWRYMSMLTNPKTHIRNIVGNAIFVPARELKNVIGAGLEKGLKVEERTKAILNPIRDRGLLKYASDDFKNVEPILKGEGKYEDNLRKLDAKVFNWKLTEGTRKFNMNLLDGEDTFFMKLAYKSSLAQYMKANKLTAEVMTEASLQKARSYAMNEALKATYRDFNALSQWISKAKKSGFEKGGGWRAVSLAADAVVPFTKTPINILRRGFDYSPVGLARGIVDVGKDLKKGKTTAEALDKLSAGMTGTGVFALGMFLYDKGIVRATSEAKRGSKEENFERMQGEQNYSLNFGDYSYTIDWAAPLSMPLFVGVELQKMRSNEGFGLGNLTDSLGTIVDPIFNLSMLQGVNELLKSNFSEQAILEMGTNLTTGYVSQFVPTVAGQVARTFDDTRRSTTSTDESASARSLERFGRQMRGKIPGASTLNEPYVDLWGREDVEPNVLKRGVENFMSPGYVQENKSTPVDMEIIRLVGQMKAEGFEDVNAIYPRKTGGYTVTKDKVEYRMTEKELTRFQRVRGQTSNKRLEELFREPSYKKASLEEKMKLISKAYDSSFEVAKSDFFTSRRME